MEKSQIDSQLILFILNEAIRAIHPKRVLLFGSRAKGTARPTSDYDIAFEFIDQPAYVRWAEFCTTINEKAPTLLSLDLINLNSVDDAFKQVILSEGVVLYEDGI